MPLLDRVHGNLVHGRRVRVLADWLARLLPQNATVLDVGCGDGLLAKIVGDARPDLTLEGIDVLVREGTHVPVRPFDGKHIDSPDGAYDAVMFVDVLHHTDDPNVLLKEAARVARQCVVLKDHTMDGPLANTTLSFMDWVGNARHGVALPYNYWPKARWLEAFKDLNLTVDQWEDRLGIYPAWARPIFERKLHFAARLNVAPVSRASSP